MTRIEKIAASLTKAAKDTAARKARITAILSRHPDGFRAGQWTKITLAGDVFWTKGSRFLTGGQLLETLGTSLITTGAISNKDFYS